MALINCSTQKNDPQDVVIDFNGSKVVDHSGIEAIDSLADRYKRAGKTIAS